MDPFDYVEVKHQQYAMYNLYNSASSFKVVYNQEIKYLLMVLWIK